MKEEPRLKIDDRLVSELGYFRICPQCKKNFYILDVEMWVYKLYDRPYCSWGCLNEKRKTVKRHNHYVRREN